MRCSGPIGASLTVLLAAIFLTTCPHADVTITQLANEGVILSDGGSARVMIDGLVVEPYSLYSGLPPDVSDQLLQASGPFSGIQLALASHQHHDHNQPAYACQFLQVSTWTRFVSSAQVIDLMREKCREFVDASSRVQIINPRYGHVSVIRLGDVKVTAFRLSHGAGKYAALQNFAYLVEIGGLRILHIGDAAIDPQDFIRADVGKLGADVALVPFWFYQPGPGGETLHQFLDAPHQIAVHIPPAEMEDVETYLRAEYPQVVVLHKVLDQIQFSSDGNP